VLVDEALTQSIPRSVWYGWGDPDRAHPLSSSAWAVLDREAGIRASTAVGPVGLDEVRLPDRRLRADLARALEEVVGAEHVHVDRAWRVEHAGGKGYPDLVRLRAGDGSHAPDAVVVPGSPVEVAALLAVCDEHRVAVVPFGGGTSVVGGIGGGLAGRGAFSAFVCLDLRRLNAVGHIDEVSRTATLGPGLRGPDVERLLRERGLTLGHFPQSHQEASLGGYVATRSAGQASTGYGRLEDNVLGVRLATPAGELVLGGRSPASAAGPRLLDLVVGSEGSLGVITEVTLALAAAPTTKRYAAWLLPSLVAGTDALRTLAQDVGPGLLPAVCRLSDETETRVNLGMAGRAGRAMLGWARARRMRSPVLLVLVWEGRDPETLAHAESACRRPLRDAGGHRLPRAVARAWEKGRFSGPYLRDELLGHGVLVETVETATTWRNLLPLHTAVEAALRESLAPDGRRVLVMCHVSLVYATGASLYFTVVARQEDDALAQWSRLKEAASEAIMAAGGTITHHHGVGVDHRRHLTTEVGELGIRLIRAAKAELDPHGILNPGVLVAADHAVPD
jgi:alkyldihydroxyacetonephosphate synthase